MGIINKIKAIRDQYVSNQVQQTKLPTFEEDNVCRWLIVFSGRVQGVGFRLELSEMAKRLSLTGYCCNLDTGEVQAEIQGPKNKIEYLLQFMQSIKRIRIDDMKITEMPCIESEIGFRKGF